jgi:hypothetical protein
VKGLGKPGAGEPHARFDEGRLETEPGLGTAEPAPILRGQRRATRPPRQPPTLPLGSLIPAAQILAVRELKLFAWSMLRRIRYGRVVSRSKRWVKLLTRMTSALRERARLTEPFVHCNSSSEPRAVLCAAWF